MADGNEALLLLIDQVTGENPTTWGEKADTNFAMLAQAAMNAYPYSVGSATGDLTLTDTAHAANQNRRGLIRAVGTRSEAGNLILPTRQLRWFILNETAYTLTAKTSAGTGIAIPPDEIRLVYCDGTNVEDTGLINQTQLTAQLAAVSAAGFTTTSTTSNAISVAGTNLSFTLAASGKAMAAGTPVRVALTSDPANHYMDMITTSYSGAAWAGTVVSATGSGTYSAWTFSVAGGPSVTMATRIRKPKTGAYVVTSDDNGALIDCTSGTFTVTLPALASVGDGFNVGIVNSGSGTITVDGDGSESIGGALTQTLAQYQAIDVLGDGSTGWRITGESNELTTGTSDGNVPVYGSGAINMADKILQRATLKDTSETMQTVAAASTTNIDITAGNVVNLTQDTNVSTMTFDNPSPTGSFCGLTIIRTKDASGTTRTIAWPSSVDWEGGVAPTLTQTTGAVDIFVFFTIDAGTRWHGMAVSLDSK